MSSEILHCWNCQEELELDPDFDPEEDDHIECDNCGEMCVVMGTRTMSEDEAYEARCESEESKRYEEAAFGSDDEGDEEPDTRTFRDD